MERHSTGRDTISFRILADALNGNSVTRALKNRRNALVDTYFRSRRRGEGAALADRLRSENVDQVCFTIAFNAPWALDMLTAAWEKYCPSFRLVVIDNSNAESSRERNRRICEARSIPYLGLPSNPEWSPNRSHGIAMNWTYYNVVRKLEPTLFGFIDHDCFPVRPFDIAARLTGKSVYGLRQYSLTTAGAWHLWAGFCFFRFADVLAQPLDFKHRIEFGLDTGGGNWKGFYRTMSDEAIAAAPLGSTDIEIGDGVSQHALIDGAFLHLGGASYSGRFTGGDLRARLSKRIWETYLSDCVAQDAAS